MNIAIFGGAFDPVTVAHLFILEHVISSHTIKIDKIYIEPAHDSYKNIKVSWKQRIDMIREGLKNLNPKISHKINIGFYDVLNEKDEQPYAYETLKYYDTGTDNIYYIIGTDELKIFHLWKKPRRLLKKYKWIVFERGDDDADEIIISNKLLKKYVNNFIIFSFGSDVSSTKARENGEGISQNVLDYINHYKLYDKIRTIN